MKKSKKRALTLLEVMIAVSITALLLGTLWTLYRNWYTSYEQSRQLQERLQKILFLKQRLEHLFSLTARPGENRFVFTPADSDSLCLSYEGEPDPDPRFNSILRSLLHVDEAGFLRLTTWNPSMERRTELLLDRVEALKIEFFDRQTACWLSKWSEELDHLPRFVRIGITTSGESEELIFAASRSLEPILFFHTVQEPGSS